MSPKKIIEEIDERYFNYWGFVSVHREELDKIINLLQPHGKISIESGEYEFENLDELQKHFKGNVPNLVIKLNGEKENNESYLVTLKFNKKSNVILTSYKEEGKLFYEIKEILSQNHSNLKYIFNPIHIIVAGGFIGLLYSFGFISDQGVTVRDYLVISFFVIIFFVLIFGYIFSFSSYLHWSIDLTTKYTANIIQRNKDKIFIGIIIATLTTLINWLIFQFL